MDLKKTFVKITIDKHSPIFILYILVLKNFNNFYAIFVS